MADETTTPVEEKIAPPPPQKVYDTEKGWIDAPADAKFSNPDFVQKPPVGTEPPPLPEKTEAPPTDPPPTGAPKIDPPPPPPAFNKDKYVKYGFEKEEDIYTSLDSIDGIIKENEELRKRPTEIQHKSPTHAKLFAYLEQYPESTWTEVLKTGGEVMGIDPDAADGKKVLQEAFIINHPMLSREDAIFKFNKDYTDKYTLKPKEEYEVPERYDQDKRSNEIDLKIQEDKARSVVREAKAKLIVEKKPETTTAAPIAPAEQVQAYTREIEKVLDGSTKGTGTAYMDKDFIRVKADEKGEPLINIQLPADKMKELKENLLFHVKNPMVYDKSGKIPNFDPVKGTLQLAFALWPEWISQQMAKQVDTLASIKKVDQIASTTPDKVETVKGADIKTMSADDQFRMLAENERKKREAQPHIMR